MERARVSLLFLVILFMGVNQMVRASEDAEFGQEKCFCPPSGGGSVPSTPSVSPPSGGSYSPPDGSGIISPPPSGATPTYSSPPPSGGSTSSPVTPSYSSPPPATPSTPALTPPYTAPSGGSSSSPTTPCPSPPKKKKRHSHSTPSYSSPPSPSSSSSSPTTPSYDTPPSGGSSSPKAPSTPSYSTPPYSPIPSAPGDGIPSTAPSTPSPDISAPTTPSLPDFSPPGVPGSGTGTCDFWGSHTSSFPDILSIFSSVADLFGSGSSFSAAWGSNDLSLHQALTNNRKDGYGSLLREGSAALLNSAVNPLFELRPEQVRNQFNRALVSNHAAAVQGAKFKAFNEGRLLP